MGTKRTAGKDTPRARPVKAANRAAPAPKVAVDGDLNPGLCRYDSAKGAVVLGLDVFDGGRWETVLVQFGVLLPDEVALLERVVGDAKAAIPK